MSYICPVCGFPDLHKDPKHLGSFEICPSCYFQFGVSDRDRGFTYEQWRRRWVDAGMLWQSKGMKLPSDWNPKKQLQNINLP